MKKIRVVSLLLVAAGLFTGCGTSVTEKTLEVSTSTNPVVGNYGTGNYEYGGDPSVLVDGDTVYIYTGVDASTDGEVASAVYNIPEYVCYSSTDLVNWNKEGTVLSMEDVDWTSDNTSAWASQVVKYNDKYYMYFCSWDKTNNGKQSIGVAVSDSPTGPFEDIGQPIVGGNVTTTQASNWEDIDPTAWVSTDDNGVEHRYLAWGNSKFFICELNEDMTSVKDINGDGQITFGDDGDIVNNQAALSSYTEAPWLYRRTDEDGNQYGPYYLFYSDGWREKMTYAISDDPMYGEWETEDDISRPNATANTNHTGVFDFQGKTYMVYHNGALPGGNGYRRSACIMEISFDDDGYVEIFEETTAGIGGTTVTLSDEDGNLVTHEHFVNSTDDSAYPYSQIGFGVSDESTDLDSQWVLVPGLCDTSNEVYVSIESENKTGLYITASSETEVYLAQDADGSEDTANSMTFRSLEGFDNKDGVTFESVAYPGTYLTMTDGQLSLTDGKDKASVTFYIQ